VECVMVGGARRGGGLHGGRGASRRWRRGECGGGVGGGGGGGTGCRQEGGAVVGVSVTFGVLAYGIFILKGARGD